MAYANSADPDQTAPEGGPEGGRQHSEAPEGAVWSGSTLFAIPLSILRNYCIKSKISAKKVWNKVFDFLRHLP